MIEIEWSLSQLLESKAIFKDSYSDDFPNVVNIFFSLSIHPSLGTLSIAQFDQALEHHSKCNPRGFSEDKNSVSRKQFVRSLKTRTIAIILILILVGFQIISCSFLLSMSKENMSFVLLYVLYDQNF